MLETKKIQVGTDAEQYYYNGVKVDNETNYGGDFLSPIPYHLQRNKGSLSFILD
jgi:hypothetical protein